MTDKQQAFVQAYCNPLNNFNATRAYCKAYGVCYHSAYRTAQVNASKLLSKTIIQNAIDVERARILKQHEEMVSFVLHEWHTMATADIMQLLNIEGPNVSLKDVSEIPPHLLACIKSIKTTAHGMDVTFHDKNRALENIAKALGMFTTIINNVNEPYEDLVTRIERQRHEEKQGIEE